MNWKPEEITFSSALVVRTPAFPFSRLSFDDNFFRDIMADETFLRALYLANPSVFLEAESWMSGKKMEAKREKKLRRTLFNYWSRMHSNCTPFGFFANVFTAHWGDQTQINVDEGHPALRVDMDLLAHLAGYIENIPEIRNFLLFYPNNTCYEVDDKIRYNEFYFEGTKMRYRLSAVENSDLLLD
ncbi:MAG: lantibiotic dehydratase, partial [Saprospiraceae bacterium]|nr:lantibiotic dehydratase [Saprospiraceae bacterium]